MGTLAEAARQSAEQKAALVIEKLGSIRVSKAAGIVGEGVREKLSYTAFPREHQRCIRDQ